MWLNIKYLYLYKLLSHKNFPYDFNNRIGNIFSLEIVIMIYLCCYTHTYTSISELSSRPKRRCWSWWTNLISIFLQFKGQVKTDAPLWKKSISLSLIALYMIPLLTILLKSLGFTSSIFHPFFSRISGVNGTPDNSNWCTGCSI